MSEKESAMCIEGMLKSGETSESVTHIKKLLRVLFITVGLKKKQRTKKCHELMLSLLYHCCFMNKILLLVKYAFFLFMIKVGNKCPYEFFSPVFLSVK